MRSRTEELRDRNDRLQAQADRLAELDRLKNAFVANVSHELRTPLALIAGPLEKVLPAVEDPSARRSLDMVRRNAERLALLVDQLMDVARLESGGVPIRARRLDLGAFVRRTLERFDPACAAASLSLQSDTPAGPVPTFFDDDILDKVLSNLLSNALKFTPAGGSIHVALEAPEHGEWARLRVSDSGIGIAQGDLVAIFDRFHQVESGMDRGREGAGIGLALARELVELHGGELFVQSVLGEGSTFTVHMPRGADHLAPGEIATSLRVAPAAEGADSEPGAPSESPGRARVLVVEDHPDMRAFLVEQLSEYFDVASACDGAEGLQAARDQRPGVIVSDVMMPGVDGLEMCRRLRADADLASIPVLLLSAKAEADDRADGLEVADDYMAKPFRMREVVARVHALLRRAEPSPDTSPPPVAVVDDEDAQRLREAVLRGMGDDGFDIASLAKQLGISSRQLRRDVRRLTGDSPSAYVRRVRIEQAHQMLVTGAYSTVAEVAAAVGFTPNYFSRLYANWFGRPPTEDLAS